MSLNRLVGSVSKDFPIDIKPKKESPPVEEVVEVEHIPSDAPMVFEEDLIAQAEEYYPDVAEPETSSRRPSWMGDVQIIKPEITEVRKPIEEIKTESITYFRGNVLLAQSFV